MAYAYLVQSTQQTGDILLLTLVPKGRHKQLVFTAGQYAAISFLRGGRPTPMRCFP